MKSLVVYSSQTGNTRKLAKAVYEALPGEKALYPIDEAPDTAEVRDIIQIAFQAITIMLDEIFEEDIDRFLSINSLVEQAEEEGLILKKSNGSPYKYIDPIIIAPQESLGSAVDFENNRLRALLELGRERASKVLSEIAK